jgi:hypothetical protein
LAEHQRQQCHPAWLPCASHSRPPLVSRPALVKGLKLLIQQEHERISKSQPNDLDLSIVQARCLCWLALLAEAHEDQANDAEKRGDAEQAMGWFADSMRLRDVINLVTSIEIPLPDSPDSLDKNDEL